MWMNFVTKNSFRNSYHMHALRSSELRKHAERPLCLCITKIQTLEDAESL